MPARLTTCCLLIAFAVTPGVSQSFSNRKPDSIPLPSRTVITLCQDGLVIKIGANGIVIVEGESFDFDIARIKMSISEEEVKDLLKEFERINYFSLPDRYYGKADGCPRNGASCTFIAITTSLTLNGKSKSVTRLPYSCLEADGSSYPRELVGLERRIKQTIDLRRR
jgi:hypothetical protein